METTTEQLEKLIDERIANRIGKKTEEKEKHKKAIPPVIDSAAEAKKMSDAAYRAKLKKLLQKCFSISPMLTPDELSFIREVKGKFKRNEVVTKDEARQMNSILTRARETSIVKNNH